MLLANISVAKKIEEVFLQTAGLRYVLHTYVRALLIHDNILIRCHLPPPRTNLEKRHSTEVKRDKA